MVATFKSVLVRYAEFEGRTGRSAYWTYLLVLGLLLLTLYGAGRALIYLVGWPPAAVGWLETAVLVATIPFLLPTLSATVRRLQDSDHQPWWLALIVLGALPVLGYVVGGILLYLLWLPGTAGPNGYGADGETSVR